MNKQYIGDGVYIEHDGYYLILTTEDGISVTNRICLEDVVWNNLFNYVLHLMNERKRNGEKEKGKTSST